MPPINNRNPRRVVRGRNDHDDSSSSSDDSDAPPVLLPRGHNADDSSTDDEEVPGLEARGLHDSSSFSTTSRSDNVDNDDDNDDDSSAEPAPPLYSPNLAFRGFDGGSSTSEDDDDSGDDAEAFAGLRAGFLSRQGPTIPARRRSDDKDNELSDAEMPSLQDNSADSDELPTLIQHKTKPDTPDPRRHYVESSSSEEQVDDSEQEKKPRFSPARRNRLTTEGTALTIPQLKLFLTYHEVDIKPLQTKPALVNAYVTLLDQEETPPAPRGMPNPLPMMPKIVQIRTADAPKDGIWILTQPNENLIYAYQNTDGVLEKQEHSELPIKQVTFLVPGTHGGSAWLIGIESTTERWSVYHRTETGIGRFLYRLNDKPMAVVPNGIGGCFALFPASDQDRSKSLLALYSGAHLQGHTVISLLPNSCSLQPHRSGGVFLRIPPHSNDTDIMEAGLWFVSVFGDVQQLASPTTDYLWTSDAQRAGIWWLAPGRTSQTSVLTHVLSSGAFHQHPQQVLNVPFDSVQSVIDCGFLPILHHKDGNRWKLSQAVPGKRQLEFFHDCPKTNRLTPSHMCLWMTKKVGKKSAERVLWRLDRNAQLDESTERYPQNSILQSV